MWLWNQQQALEVGDGDARQGRRQGVRPGNQPLWKCHTTAHTHTPTSSAARRRCALGRERAASCSPRTSRRRARWALSSPGFPVCSPLYAPLPCAAALDHWDTAQARNSPTSHTDELCPPNQTWTASPFMLTPGGRLPSGGGRAPALHALPPVPARLVQRGGLPGELRVPCRCSRSQSVLGFRAGTFSIYLHTAVIKDQVASHSH